MTEEFPRSTYHRPGGSQKTMRPRRPVMLVNDHKRALKTTKPSTEDAFNTDEVIREYDQERAPSLRHRKELSKTHLKGDATTSAKAGCLSFTVSPSWSQDTGFHS